jgi:hypothetical protein
MQDFLNLIMLVLASIASMLLGVLAAYGICKSAFALMRWHSEQNAQLRAKSSPAPARAS